MSVEFLYELFATALRSETICGVVARHVKKEYLPDRAFQKILLAVSTHYRNYKEPPSYAVLSQLFNGDYDTMELVNTFRKARARRIRKYCWICWKPISRGYACR